MYHITAEDAFTLRALHKIVAHHAGAVAHERDHHVGMVVKQTNTSAIPRETNTWHVS